MERQNHRFVRKKSKKKLQSLRILLNPSSCSGLSRTLEGLSGVMSPVGTVQWAAPELLAGNQYSTEADVYVRCFFFFFFPSPFYPYCDIANFPISRLE